MDRLLRAFARVRPISATLLNRVVIQHTSVLVLTGATFAVIYSSADKVAFAESSTSSGSQSATASSNRSIGGEKKRFDKELFRNCLLSIFSPETNIHEKTNELQNLAAMIEDFDLSVTAIPYLMNDASILRLTSLASSSSTSSSSSSNSS